MLWRDMSPKQREEMTRPVTPGKEFVPASKRMTPKEAKLFAKDMRRLERQRAAIMGEES